MDNSNFENSLKWYCLPELALKNGMQIIDKLNSNIVLIDEMEENQENYQCVIEIENKNNQDVIKISSPLLYYENQTEIFCDEQKGTECINAYYNLLFGNKLIGMDSKSVIEATMESTSGVYIVVNTTSNNWQENLIDKLYICKDKEYQKVLLSMVGDISLMDIQPVADYVDEYFGKYLMVYAQGDYKDDFNENEYIINLWFLE